MDEKVNSLLDYLKIVENRAINYKSEDNTTNMQLDMIKRGCECILDNCDRFEKERGV